MSTFLAVLIDHENVPCSDAAALGRLIDGLRARGSIRVLRAYADWSREAARSTEVARLGVELVMAPPGPSGKNSADIQLIMDALELAIRKPELDTFVIASGDADMAPLLQRLRSLGRRVILGARKTSVSSRLIALCDEFIDCGTPPPRPVPPVPAKSLRAFEALRAVVDAAVSIDDVWGPKLLVRLQERLPQFDYKALGHSQFGKFAEAAAAAGYCRVQRTEAGFSVHPIGRTLKAAPAVVASEVQEPPQALGIPAATDDGSWSQAVAALKEVLATANRPQGVDPPSLLRDIKHILPAFDYRSLGYKKLREFVEAAAAAGACVIEVVEGPGFLARAVHTPC